VEISAEHGKQSTIFTVKILQTGIVFFFNHLAGVWELDLTVKESVAIDSIVCSML
jgi:hypothetical protein